MSRLNSPTVRRRRLGLALRQLREAAGLTNEEVARHLECSKAKVSRVENGKLSARTRDVRDMLDLYGVTDESARQSLLDLTTLSREPGWWSGYDDVLPAGFDTYVGLEADAASLRYFSATAVHGLLQTEGYARFLIRAGRPNSDEARVERLVQLRMQRQELLGRTPEPIRLWLILDEAVVRRPIGGASTLRDQLRHLIEQAQSPLITLQILPFRKGAHCALSGAFTLIEFPDEADRGLVYVESPVGNLYVDKPAEVRSMADTFDLLRAEAMDPEESLRFVRDACEEL